MATTYCNACSVSSFRLVELGLVARPGWLTLAGSGCFLP